METSSPIVLAQELLESLVTSSKIHKGLIMIVKNESRIILRALESAWKEVKGEPFFSFFSICDTGSGDGTPEKIRGWMKEKGVPGKVHEHEWKSFSYNRELSFQAGLEVAEELGISRNSLLLFSMDADHEIQGLEEFKPDLLLTGLWVGFSLWVKSFDDEHPFLHVFYAGVDWTLRWRTHEIWRPKEERYVGRDTLLPGVWLRHHGDGGTRPEKFKRDLFLLAQDKEEFPEDPRPWFYEGETRRHLGFYREALESYQGCLRYSRWEQEKWYCHYAQAICEEKLGNWPQALNLYLTAYQLRPSRAEPLYNLANHYRNAGSHRLAMLFATQGVGVKPLEGDTLFLDPRVYSYRFDLEFAIISYYLGHQKLGLRSCEKVLFLPSARVSRVERNCVSSNLQFYASSLDSLLGETITKLSFLALLREEGYYKKMKLSLETSPDEPGLDWAPLNPSVLWSSYYKSYLVLLRFVNYRRVGERYVIPTPDQAVKTRNFLLRMSESLHLQGVWEVQVPERLLPAKRHSRVQGLEDLRIFQLPTDPRTLWFTCSSCEYHSQLPEKKLQQEGNFPQICLGSLKLDSLGSDANPPIGRGFGMQKRKSSSSKASGTSGGGKKRVGKLWVNTLISLSSPFQRGCEKNWLPFTRTEEPLSAYLLYATCGAEKGETLTLKLEDDYFRDPAAWNIDCRIIPKLLSPKPVPRSLNLSDFRGSASPVWLSKPECWLYLVHEVLATPERKYLHRFVKLTPELQVESFSDPFYFEKLEVEYASGLTLTPSGSSLLLTFGRLDSRAYFCFLPVEKVLSLLRI